MESIAFTGRTLHRGEVARVRLQRRPGPVVLSQGDEHHAVSELVVADADRGVTVAARGGDLRVGLVEHLFGALGGLGIFGGLEVRVEGRELPLLDGSASEWVAALAALGLGRGRPRLSVRRDGVVAVGLSRYAFRVGSHPVLTVEVDFPVVGKEAARWDGTAQRFAASIARARTFGFAHELEELRARSLAAWVDPEVVLVLDERGEALPPGRPREAEELARHKLLDLVGDLYLHGGPPLGEIHAERPGHAATHRAVQEALERGLLAVEAGS